MQCLYNFFGGRKLFYFNLLLVVNYVSLLLGKWQEGFGWFSIGVYSVVVAGIEGNKYIKGKNEH